MSSACKESVVSPEANPKNPRSRNDKWATFFILLSLSLAHLGGWLSGDLKFETLTDWYFLFTAISFTALTAVSWKRLENKWSINHSKQLIKKGLVFLLKAVNHSKQVIKKVLVFLLKAVFVIFLVAVVGWVLVSFFGWLGTIPLWAAVIIVLLILK